MAIVLGAVGAFVYLRFAAELDATINAGLRSRASDVSALVFREADASLRRGREQFVGHGESFAEVLNRDGEIEDSSAAVGDQVLLSREELRRALREPIFLDRGPLPGLKRESRLLAVPVDSPGVRRVAVVGTSTVGRAESLEDLRTLLLIGGPFALLLASLAAYGVAAGALRPVDAMRARAAEISAADPGKRLPVPPSGDEVARLGSTLNEMLERLGDALEHERTFVADASHELRTPLAILRGELELALAEGRTPEELREAIHSAAEETDRLTQLSEDLLTIAQTEQGELPLDLSTVELRQTLEAVRRRFSRRAEASGRELVVTGPEVEVRGTRCDSTRRSAASSTTRFATAGAGSRSTCGRRRMRSRSTSPMRVRASRRSFSTAPSSVSAGRQPAGETAAAGSAWRSCVPSPSPTAVRHTRRTSPTVVPTYG